MKKIQNLSCGVARTLKSPPTKEPIILLLGEWLEEGILEALAIARILPSYPEWKLVIAGARRFEEATAGSYEEKVAAIAPLGDQAEMTGFIPQTSFGNGKNVLQLPPVHQYGGTSGESRY